MIYYIKHTDQQEPSQILFSLQIQLVPLIHKNHLIRLCFMYGCKREISFRAEQANGRLQLEKAQHPESSQHLNTIQIYAACLKVNSIQKRFSGQQIKKCN